jgi:hypothetical protein
MGAEVFANGREISCKVSSDQSLVAMPDVCLSPPSPPAGPIPIPYPNTSMSSDTTDGSKTVSIGGKEVMLKNASSYKKSTGNEPATNSFGAGVITHKLQGATHFAAWSFDVLVEGQNVCRLGDLTTHNHQNPTNGGVTVSTGAADISLPPEDCRALHGKNEAERNRQAASPSKAVKALAPGEGKALPDHPNAIAHASVSGGGKVFGASSRSILERSQKGSGGARGVPGPGDSPSICPGNPFEYKGRHQFHAEAKILESIKKDFPAHGPTVRIAVNWLSENASKPGNTPESPCPDCQRLIAHAGKCMDVEICD